MSLDTRTPRFQKHVSFKFGEPISLARAAATWSSFVFASEPTAAGRWALSAEDALSQRSNLPVTPLGRVLVTDAGRAVARLAPRSCDAIMPDLGKFKFPDRSPG